MSDSAAPEPAEGPLAEAFGQLRDGAAPEPAEGPPAEAFGQLREPVTGDDLRVVAAQLGRAPRGTRFVAHRCPCGLPDVVETTPRLPDGTPFPTLFYLTCPRAVHECSRLESGGLMKDMNARLAEDPALAAGYRRAHEDYLHRRAEAGHVPEIDGVSAGGMPTRVKCLHVALGHALAVGEGVNPIGDETLDRLDPWWTQGPCIKEI